MKTVLFGVILSFIAGAVAHGQPCESCVQLKTELSLILKEQSDTAQLLEQNKVVLSGVAPSDTSKKVKLTSNIFILSAKTETLANNATIKQQEIEKVGCKQCPIK